MRIRLLHILLITLALKMQAENYAIVIGINTYNPSSSLVSKTREIQNLNGAVNDAQNMSQFLISKMGFHKNNVELLKEQSATRKGILSALVKAVGLAEKGDKFFFYFAGHGTQVRNSLSPEPDKLDECIVPQDAFSGAGYIRDKELKYYFAEIAKKGAVLTTIFDCCHSGSIHRSFETIPQRFLAADMESDAKDPGTSVSLEQYNILVLSASQDFQTAGEFLDLDNRYYGAFTYSLLKVLSSTGSNSEIVEVFKRVKLHLKNMGYKQEPVLVAKSERTHLNLVGDSVSFTSKNKVRILEQLSPTSYLCNFGVFNGAYKGLAFTDSSRFCTFQLDSLVGLTESILKTESSKSCNTVFCGVQNAYDQTKQCPIPLNTSLLLSGTPFSSRKLKLYFSSADVTDKELASIGIKKSNVINRSIEGANYVVAFSNEKPVLFNLTDKRVQRVYKITNSERIVFLPQALDQNIQSQLNSELGKYDIEYTKDIAKADLLLIAQSSEEVSLVELKKGHRIFRANVAKDKLIPSLDSLLYSYHQQNYWANIESLSATEPFVYDLKMEVAPNDTHLLKDNVFGLGKKFGLSLNLNHHIVNHYYNQGLRLPQYYIYVLHLGSDGTIQLLYPLHGNLDNRFPLKNTGKIASSVQLTSNDMFETSLPEGIDAFILLYTNEPIQDFNVFADMRGKRGNVQPFSLQKVFTIKYRSGKLEWGISKIQFETRLTKN